jgi:predicted glycosyltransferase involved in capsule biosynthesis
MPEITSYFTVLDSIFLMIFRQIFVFREHFLLVNGLSNVYWGWGLEDDELYARLKDAQLQIQRPGNLSTGTASFRYIRMSFKITDLKAVVGLFS